ncbi:MAG: hypothetical protein P4L93_11020 [Coriobacteriia bacterium]|nr:hypothetical protein [Coriobacteriia bacterium]
MLLVGAVGLVALRLWTSGFAPLDPTTTVFANQNFASSVIAIMLVGVFAVGLLLVLLGVAIRVTQRILAERRSKIPPRGPSSL